MFEKLEEYRRPDREQIKAFFEHYGIYGYVAADMAGLNDSSHVRRYTKKENPYNLPISTWWTWNAHTILTDQQIDEIHKLTEQYRKGDPKGQYAFYFFVACVELCTPDELSDITDRCVESLNL